MMESEYIFMAKTGRQALRYGTNLHEFGITITIKMYADNTAAILVAGLPVSLDCYRHIDMSYHFVGDHVINQKINLDYIDTPINPADIFTKALVPVTYHNSCKFIGVAVRREC